MNLPPYGFDVDHVAKIRSGLSITIVKQKATQNYRLKSDLIYKRNPILSVFWRRRTRHLESTIFTEV